ncbi:MAG: DUF1059 domain-containing protein [Nitrosopumilaceae archaeon]|nr:DUF1059 domain-containing protein [Nitrosopumilaceae archaeon]
MSRFFACENFFDSDCKWSIFAVTQNEVMSEVSKHALSEHNVNTLSDKMIEDIKNKSEEI